MSSAQHHFDREIANKYGVNVAIFLNNIAFWTEKNIANDKHQYEGRYWTYNTQKALTNIFTYWSRKNLRTIITKCLKANLIFTKNFNKNNYDRTTWYALTDLGLSLFPFLLETKNSNKINIGRDRPMDLPRPANGFASSGQSYKDTDIDTDINIDRQVDSKGVDNPGLTKAIKARRKERASPMPDNFLITDEEKDIASKNGLNLDKEMQKFKIYFRGKKRKDWKKDFLLWMLRSAEYKSAIQQNSTANHKNNEPKSTVKEWGPGHPDYDRLNMH